MERVNCIVGWRLPSRSIPVLTRNYNVDLVMNMPLIEYQDDSGALCRCCTVCVIVNNEIDMILHRVRRLYLTIIHGSKGE